MPVPARSRRVNLMISGEMSEIKCDRASTCAERFASTISALNKCGRKGATLQHPSWAGVDTGWGGRFR